MVTSLSAASAENDSAVAISAVEKSFAFIIGTFELWRRY